MKDFEITISSPSDKEKLVAEIWFKEQMIAEINQEQTDLEIEFFLKGKMVFNYEAFCKVLEKAKEQLING